MNIIYEVNPPKILNNNIFDPKLLKDELDKFLLRIDTLSKFTNYIHITDSVLGIPRFSSLDVVELLHMRIANLNLKISCSIRTRDRNINSIIQITARSVFLNIDSLLFILGDESLFEKKNSINRQFVSPTNAINNLKTLGFDKYIKLNLSISNKVSSSFNLEKKIGMEPNSFITQSISSLEEVQALKKKLEGYSIKLIPCIMIPTEKNINSARMIGLDWSSYENDFLKFIYSIQDEGIDSILITSPNSFQDGVEFLNNHKKML